MPLYCWSSEYGNKTDDTVQLDFLNEKTAYIDNVIPHSAIVKDNGQNVLVILDRWTKQHSYKAALFLLIAVTKDSAAFLLCYLTFAVLTIRHGEWGMPLLLETTVFDIGRHLKAKKFSVMRPGVIVKWTE